MIRHKFVDSLVRKPHLDMTLTSILVLCYEWGRRLLHIRLIDLNFPQRHLLLLCSMYFQSRGMDLISWSCIFVSRIWTKRYSTLTITPLYIQGPCCWWITNRRLEFFMVISRPWDTCRKTVWPHGLPFLQKAHPTSFLSLNSSLPLWTCTKNIARSSSAPLRYPLPLLLFFHLRFSVSHHVLSFDPGLIFVQFSGNLACIDRPGTSCVCEKLLPGLDDAICGVPRDAHKIIHFVAFSFPCFLSVKGPQL